MGKLARWAITFLVALLAAACGKGALSPAASAVSTGAVNTPAASSGGAVVSGSFKSGRMQVTLTGASSKQVDLRSLASSFGAPGRTALGPGYEWYDEGDARTAVTIRFPGDPVSTGTTASLPHGTGIQVEFDLIASAGDLFSSSNGECTVSITQNDTDGIRGSLDCHGVPGSSDAAKTIDAVGTFDAQP